MSDEVVGLGVALGVGLLVGVERERRKGEGSARAPAGIRTFALVALIGAITGLIGGVAAPLIAGLVLGGLVLGAYLRSPSSDPGLTTEAAILAVFLLGWLAVDQPGLASGLGVTVAILLASRERLHRFVRDVITEDELHDLLLLAAAAVVVLPLLPNRDIAGVTGLNPFRVWRLVVLVMAVSGAGYVSLRALGPGRGLPLAGLAGGFVSSAATIGSLGSLARGRPGLRRAAVAGAVLSTVATFVQMALVLAASSRATLEEMAAPLAGGGTVAIAVAASVVVRLSAGADSHGLRRRPFDLTSAVVFAATVAGVTAIASALESVAGERGVVVSAALAGFADAHAAGASVAALVASGEVDPRASPLAIIAGMTTNTLTKAAVAFASGGRDFAWPVWLGLAAVLLGLWVPALVW